MVVVQGRQGSVTETRRDGGVILRTIPRNPQESSHSDLHGSSGILRKLLIGLVVAYTLLFCLFRKLVSSLLDLTKIGGLNCLSP